MGCLSTVFLANLEVVTAVVLSLLQDYQHRGGILVDDEFTLSILALDWRIRLVFCCTADPLGMKKDLQRLGGGIRRSLDAYLKPSMLVNDPDLVVRRYGSVDADDLFLVNDKRVFGAYIGQYGLIPEKGVPCKSSASIRFPVEAAYDLIGYRRIPPMRVFTGSPRKRRKIWVIRFTP